MTISNMAAPMPPTFRAIEFYSGIGGMHYAVKASRLEASIVAAMDINDLANKVYKHNFPHGNLMQRNIQSITKAEFIELNADMFLMSPPCQPFTRVGLKGDSNDARTQSFFHLLKMLPNLPKMPSYILVENVKGFEMSDSRNCLVHTLQKCNYNQQEFLLSPTHFGIPNQRLRYFLIAKRRPLVFSPSHITKEENRVLEQQQINCDCVSGVVLDDTRHEVDVLDTNCDGHSEVVSSESYDSIQRGSGVGPCMHWGQDSNISKQEGIFESSKIKHSSTAGAISDWYQDENPNEESDCVSSCCENVVCEGSTDGTCHGQTDNKNLVAKARLKAQDPEGHHPSSPRFKSREELSCRTVGDYLQNLSLEETERFMLPDKLLKRFARIIDVVTSDDCKTRCFTKAYGHYLEGTGSMLQMNTALKGTSLLKNCSQDVGVITKEYFEQLRNLRIRYFTPREIANLHHIPEVFDFPAEVTLKQRYRVLGNGLNVHVVSVLLKYMVTESAVVTS